jgi:hypothetical protein
MSEWKVSLDAIGIALIDSQDMNYSAKLQKINKTMIAKRQLQHQELLAMKHNRLLVGKH